MSALTTWRGVFGVPAAALLLLLTACGGQGTTLVSASIDSATCANYQSVADQVRSLIGASTESRLATDLGVAGMSDAELEQTATDVEDEGETLCADEPSSSASPSTVTVTETTEVAADPVAVAKALAEEFKKKGFKAEEVTTDVNWKKHTVQRSSGFSNVTIKTNQEVSDFLSGSSHSSKQAKTLVVKAMEDRYDDPARVKMETARALSGACFVPVQFKVGVQYAGQTYLDDGKIITPTGLRQAEKGDVIWVCVDSEAEVVWEASVRADCANPKFTQIIPVRPDTPPVPPVDQPHPKCPPGQVGTPPDCLEPKDAGDHPANNGNGPSDPWNPADNDGSATPPGGGNSPDNYTPPPAPEPDQGDGNGDGHGGNPPPPEPSTPPSNSPEPAPTQNPCEVNPDFC